MKNKTMSFSIFQTELGNKLYSIKENFPFYFYSPFTVSQSTVLDANRVNNVLTSGIICDVTASSISITFPTATVLQSLLNCKVGDYVNFFISAFSETFPNANSVNIVGNTGVEPLSTSADPLDSQVTYYPTLVCASLSPLKFYII